VPVGAEHQLGGDLHGAPGHGGYCAAELVGKGRAHSPDCLGGRRGWSAMGTVQPLPLRDGEGQLHRRRGRLS
jgi:hypothetical protein